MKAINSIISSIATLVTGCIIFSSSMHAHAQAGSLDQSFYPGDGPSENVRAIQTLEDGKILIAGGFNHYDGIPVGRIALLHSNGDLDTTFDQGEGANSVIYALAIQPDGKIVIGGGFTTYDNKPINRIARLNQNGSLDTTFDPGDGFDWSIFTLALQPDGKIVVGGDFTTYDNIPTSRITRLLPNGKIDPDFKPGGGAGWVVRSLAIRPDGNIYIAGHFYSYDGVSRIRVARIHSNGQLDLTFDPLGGPNDWVTSIALQEDGKIVLGGYFSSFNGEACNYLVRLHKDGSRDSTFNTGAGLNLYVHCIATQPDGRLIVGGDFFKVNGASYRGVVRLNVNGALDAGFDPGSGFNGSPLVAAIQQDGKILLGGWFYAYDGMQISNIVRIHGDDNANSIQSIDATSHSLYPNPTSGRVQLTGLLVDKVEVYDQMGNRVLTHGCMHNQVDLTFLQDGFYYLHVHSNEKVFVHKVLKYYMLR